MPIIANFPGGSGSGGGLTLSAVSGIKTVTSHGKVYVKWTDPDDLIVAEAALATWSGTILVRKAGSAPTSRRDGVQILDSKKRNEYQNKYFTDSGLSDGETYYYKFFPYTTSNSYTDSVEDEFHATPKAVAPGNVTGLTATTSGNGKVTLKWTDPNDTIEDGITTSVWAGTKVVYKEGSAPTSAEDGDLFENSTTKNAHSVTGLQVTGLTNGTTYYFGVFPYANEETGGAANNDKANTVTGIPNRLEIAKVPTQNGTLTYNKTAQTPRWSDYDESKMTLSVTAQTDAGQYTATFTPKEDYCWAGNDTEAKTVQWQIVRAALPKPTVSKASITLNASKTSDTFAVTREGDGAVSATPDTADVVSTSVVGTTVTVNSVNKKTGTATITVKVAQGKNYNAYTATDVTVSVNAEFLPAKKTLEQQTWAEISQVAKAGEAANYWKVGDTKSLQFNGTQYVVQIIGFNHDDVTDSATYGRTKAGVTFQFGKANESATAGMYATTYKMNNSNTNSGGWESCLMRTSTMPEMKGYLPTELQSLIVKVNKKTSEGNQGTNIKTSQDDLWLLSEIEIFGKTTYSVAGEGEQYKFYKDGNSTVRYRSGSTDRWWERSPYSSNSALFCGVNYYGSAGYNNASYTRGVSFGFCL